MPELLNPFLQITDLSKTYLEGGTRRIILDQARLDVSKGQFLAILGKSGSGKTTLLNLISGIDDADSGTICLAGVSLTDMNESDRTMFRRKQVGFVFQFFNLIPTLTVWENILLPLDLNGLTANGGRQRAEDLLAEVGLLSRKNVYPDLLSGGEQQRVAIARALVHDPLIVLADEPTGNLDEDTGRSVMDLLNRLTRGMGKNIILVTHSPEAASYADRLVHLHEGKFYEKA